MVYPVPITGPAPVKWPVLPPSVSDLTAVVLPEYLDQWGGEDVFSHAENDSAVQNGYARFRYNESARGYAKGLEVHAETIYRQIEGQYRLSIDYLGQNVDIYG